MPMMLTAPRSALSLKAGPSLLAWTTAVLCLAYGYAVWTRPIVPVELQIQYPAKYGFPPWYGPGSSPYDLTSTSPRSEREDECEVKARVLVFVDLPYNSSYIPQALSTLRALETDTSNEVMVTSSFSPSWNATLSQDENLERAGCADWIFHIASGEGDDTQLLGTKGFKACNETLWIDFLLSPPGTKNINTRANLTLLPQPHHLFSDSASYESLSKDADSTWEIGLFAHLLPQAADTLFYPSHLLRRRVTYFPASTTAKKVYPAIPWGHQWTIFHPNTAQPPSLRAGEDPWLPDSRWRRYWEKEEKRRAKGMRSAGICLFEGWEKGLLTGDMIQAFLSGCLVAAVIPNVEHDLLISLMLPLARPEISSSPPPFPEAALRKHLALSGTIRAKKSLDGFIMARQKFTSEAWRRGLKETLGIWADGGRGYMLPNRFRWSCESSPEAPWCQVDGTRKNLLIPE